MYHIKCWACDKWVVLCFGISYVKAYRALWNVRSISINSFTFSILITHGVYNLEPSCLVSCKARWHTWHRLLAKWLRLTFISVPCFSTIVFNESIFVQFNFCSTWCCWLKVIIWMSSVQHSVVLSTNNTIETCKSWPSQAGSIILLIISSTNTWKSE
jgi:hypothetical protein